MGIGFHSTKVRYLADILVSPNLLIPGEISDHRSKLPSGKVLLWYKKIIYNCTYYLFLNFLKGKSAFSFLWGEPTWLHSTWYFQITEFPHLVGSQEGTHFLKRVEKALLCYFCSVFKPVTSSVQSFTIFILHFKLAAINEGGQRTPFIHSKFFDPQITTKHLTSLVGQAAPGRLYFGYCCGFQLLVKLKIPHSGFSGGFPPNANSTPWK